MQKSHPVNKPIYSYQKKQSKLSDLIFESNYDFDSDEENPFSCLPSWEPLQQMREMPSEWIRDEYSFSFSFPFFKTKLNFISVPIFYGYYHD